MFCTQYDYRISEAANDRLMAYFEKIYWERNDEFGNGRDVRNFFEKTITNQSQRMFRLPNASREELMEIVIEDLSLDSSFPLR